MCQSITILNAIKKTKGCGGMTKSQLMLAEAQAEDMQAMKKELQEVKMDIASLKTNVANIDGKLDLLIKQSESRPFLQVFKELINTRGFWIVLALVVIGIYGIDLSGLREFIK
jgi:hypothetical protein